MLTCAVCQKQRKDARSMRSHMERDHGDAISLPTPAPAAPRAAGPLVRVYLRVSTEDQENANQRLRIKAALAQRGWANVIEYEDKESGAKTDRPGLLRLQYDVQKGDVVCFLRADRLSRSLKDFVAITEYLHDCGAEIYCVEQPIDTTSPMGRAFWQILGVFAELERSLIIQRTVDGMRRAKADGRPIGRHRAGCGVLFPCPTGTHANDGLPTRPPRGVRYTTWEDPRGVIAQAGITALVAAPAAPSAQLYPDPLPLVAPSAAQHGTLDAAINATLPPTPDVPEKPGRVRKDGTSRTHSGHGMTTHHAKGVSRGKVWSDEVPLSPEKGTPENGGE